MMLLPLFIVRNQNNTTTITTSHCRWKFRTTTSATLLLLLSILLLVTKVYADNDTDQHVVVTNPLVKFLESSMHSPSFILLKWDATGNLEKITPIERIDWFTNETRTKLFSTTNPSQYGKAALLLNTDILQFVDYTIPPPVPLMLYTIPNTHTNDPNYIVIPNVYDRSGFNDWVLYDLQQQLRHDIPSFNEYIDNRTNTIVWRGTVHADMDLFRTKLFAMSEAQPIDQPKWLDATDTKKHPETQLSVYEMVRNYKYQLDVGGVSGTAWGGLRWKMCSGSIVLKVDTWSQDWWHSTLQPYVHYIPVASDFSNLQDQYRWAEQHPKEVYQIAKNGQMECQKTIKREHSEQRQIEITNTLPAITSPELLHYVDEIFDQYLDRFFVPVEETNNNQDNDTSNVSV